MPTVRVSKRPSRDLEHLRRAQTADPLTGELLAWYDRHRRALPWRALPGQQPDPYAVWLSEIMLQQTTVQAVKPFFAKFLAAWPSVDRLAAASLDEVLRAWAGLGYYSRARNLHACAQAIMARHAGRFPSHEATLRTLPGVGDYTAAAIAAIAFGRHAAVVDGNVERVITRIDALDQPLPSARPAIRARMAALTPMDRPGDFAQATMDLGATICTPRNPACAICPLSGPCRARQTGMQALFPVKPQKRTQPTRRGAAYYLRNLAGEVAVRTRPANGLLGGMTELPGSDWSVEAPSLPPSFRNVGCIKHVFTHFTLFLDVMVCPPGDSAVLIASLGASEIRWVSPERLLDEALPTLMKNAVETARRGLAAQSSDEPTAWVS